MTFPKVVYITYDGLLEPLGQSQVLAYLEMLAVQRSIHVLSFEKEKDLRDVLRMDDMRARLKRSDIGWTPLAYHKSPSIPATAFDLTLGAIVATYLVLRKRADIIHARSYVPALMALAVKRVTGARFIFDMRGFWADERVDGGLWPKDSRLFRATKRLEARFIESADHIVTLTHASVNEMARWPAIAKCKPPISVIPTCADLTLFRPQLAPARDSFVFGYVGSVGTWYLLDEIVKFYLALRQRRADARMLVVNRSEHELIRATFARHGVEAERVEVVAAEHRDVPRQIARMHAAAAIIKPSYSKISSAPTKVAEYLGCGVPCVGNVGVGDMEELLEGRGVGVALRDFSDMDRENAVDRLLALCNQQDLRDRCVATANALFSLNHGVAEYSRIYDRLCSGKR